ncbi:MAG: phage head closure protein [Bacteroidales bacterium]|nr:phage head closure protein [Bacteroidales bacterium]
MKYKLVLLRPSGAVDDFGDDKSEEFTAVRTVNAERVRISGSRSMEVGENLPDYRAEFRIRDAHPVRENWRVQQLGGNLYTVTNIIPNLDRGMLTLVCDLVNR